MNSKFVLSLTIMVFATSISGHSDTAYSHNSNDQFIFYENWMRYIRDDVLLSELALPGTHDSSTFTVRNSHKYQTQSLDFKQQFDYGIRVFDIRFKHTVNRLALHHGRRFLDLWFGDFLKVLDECLTKHPTEVVLFKLKEDKKQRRNTRRLNQTLEWYLRCYASKYVRVTTNIQLGQVRGKFIIINHVKRLNRFDYGLNYKSFVIQDKFKLSSEKDLYNKWEKVKRHFSTTISGNRRTFYMNFLSGAIGAYPYFVASGHEAPETAAHRKSTGIRCDNKTFVDFPRITPDFGEDCQIHYEGTNTLLRGIILNRRHQLNHTRTVGIIMSDFPGKSLIQAIISDNNQYRHR